MAKNPRRRPTTPSTPAMPADDGLIYNWADERERRRVENCAAAPPDPNDPLTIAREQRAIVEAQLSQRLPDILAAAREAHIDSNALLSFRRLVEEALMGMHRPGFDYEDHPLFDAALSVLEQVEMLNPNKYKDIRTQWCEWLMHSRAVWNKVQDNDAWLFDDKRTCLSAARPHEPTGEIAPNDALAEVDNQRKSQQESQPLIPEDAAILKVLLQSQPVTMTVEKIAARVTLSDKTIRTRLQSLDGRELVERPIPKKGACLTPSGVEVAVKLSEDAGQEFLRSSKPVR